MDIQVDFLRWQVPDLKEYLQHRGITCHLYRKRDLVKLCELSQELNLEKITSTNDYELSQVNRRTITENGVTQVVCEIGQVSIWSSDIKLLPNIEQCDILVYLLKKCDWNGDRLKLYKKDNGYALFCAGHVLDVKLSLIPGTQSFYYILATCVPETRQSEDPYTVWLIIEKSGSVVSGGCSCVV
jgi:hypothetical protein